jgi:2-methylcitrate dehydratase
MQDMTEVQRLAAFVQRASYDELSEDARRQLKVRVLDALGCALGAVGAEPMSMIRAQLDDFGGRQLCSLIGGGSTAPDRAAFYNGALVRYLDFNDGYLAKGETCHPSDNLAPVLAAAEYADRSGRETLTALAVAYQVQCRLSDLAPVRARGFDHTTQGAYAVAAGAAKALGLSEPQTANAIAISGTAYNALRVARTGTLSHWKGLAYPNTGFGATHAAFLAMRGITGPPEVFEGNKGFMDTIAGPFTLDWSQEDLERVTRTIVKRYNAELHSQATLEGVLELRGEHPELEAGVEGVAIETFDVAYNIIGGGEEGDKLVVRTKEQADHSLRYMVAVALLDGEVMPPQYLPERIARRDVQQLLRRVEVRPVEALSREFPQRMPCRITVSLRDGRKLVKEKQDYEGFLSRPMRWETVVEKFERLSEAQAEATLRREITDAVAHLEQLRIVELMRLLTRARR